MDKISYVNKMWIQTFREIGFWVDTNFSEEDWNLSSAFSLAIVEVVRHFNSVLSVGNSWEVRYITH